MSGTTTPPATVATAVPPKDGIAAIIKEWGTIIMSIISLLIYGCAFWLAYHMKNDAMLTTFGGVAAAQAMTVMNYWVGSSAGSSNKDTTIAALANPTPPVPPVAPLIRTP